jgi:plasmid stability protein
MNEEFIAARAARHDLSIEAEAAKIIAEARLKADRLTADAELSVKDAVRRAEMEARAKTASFVQKARLDAAEQAAQDAMLVKGSKATAISAHVLVGQILKNAALPLAQQVIDAVTSGTLNPREARELLTALALAARAVNEASQTAFKLGKLHVGEPTEILGFTQPPPTLEDADAKLRRLQDLVATARAGRTALANTTSGDGEATSSNPPAPSGGTVH